ncbi:hypothetical protein RB2083_3991 [Rhodobacteraceae bacterium HTCC2083]|nr:hypothetical protein RB2083_3991 [Rhodobacteraceae bacterium HTCC2083]
MWAFCVPDDLPKESLAKVMIFPIFARSDEFRVGQAREPRI